MRKFRLILIFILAVASWNTISAQEVYNYVLQSSTRIVDDPTSSFTHTRIAQFKKTALVYLGAKAKDTMPEVTDVFLNEQAYYLSEFVANFLEDVLDDSQRKKSAKKKAILNYINASLMNPLFEDTDVETTEIYLREGDELTPFSLNTDWKKAYHTAIAYKKMDKNKKN